MVALNPAVKSALRGIGSWICIAAIGFGFGCAGRLIIEQWNDSPSMVEIDICP